MKVVRVLAVVLMAACLLSVKLSGESRAIAAQGCPRGSLRGNLISQGDQATLSIRSESYRCVPPTIERSGSAAVAPTYTFELLCNPKSDQGPKTLCSVAPCLQDNQSFALRNRRLPDGRLEPAGFACLTSNQVSVSPGITLAQVYAAVRTVKLPGGNIQVTPASQGLSNLKSYFWVEGVEQEPDAMVAKLGGIRPPAFGNLGNDRQVTLVERHHVVLAEKDIDLTALAAVSRND